MQVEILNALLASLSQDSRNELLSAGRFVRLRRNRTLYDQGERSAYGYFIQTGLASVVVETSAGEQVEVGMIGNEGLVGIATILGPALHTTRCLLQLDSTAIEVPIEVLRRLFAGIPEIRQRLLEFGQTYLHSTERVAACNRVHLAPERLVRWLLMAHTYGQTGQLPFTHEFLAQMVAVQRTTVSAALNSLQAEGLIDHGWGSVIIKNRKGLEARACSCYQILKDLHCNLFLGALVR